MGARGPKKTTGAERSVRVQQGSALERLTEGQSFTEAIHRMAELFETALKENWGPQPVYVGIDYSKGEDVTVLVDEQGREVHHIGGEAHVIPRTFVIGHDERTAQEVDETQLLALAREQYPAGLVPVGLDDGDGEVVSDETISAEPDLTSVDEDDSWAADLT